MGMARFAQLVVEAVAVVFDCAPAVEANWVASLAVFGVTFECNSVNSSCLLSEGQ